jgi:CRP-like cAMP-binding protein
LKDHLVPTTLRPGQLLNAPGEDYQQVHFLTGGLVSAFAVFESGEQIECALVGRSSAVGLLAAIGFPRALTQNVSHFHSHAWSIRPQQLQGAMRDSPTIAEAITRGSEFHINYGIRVGACNAIHTLEQRLARWLLCAGEHLEMREVRLPQEVFGHALGAQRTSINPALQRFQKEALIRLGRARVEILDQEGLQQRACECYAALCPRRARW